MIFDRNSNEFPLFSLSPLCPESTIMKIIQFNSSNMGTEFSSGKEANIFNYNDDGY